MLNSGLLFGKQQERLSGADVPCQLRLSFLPTAASTEGQRDAVGREELASGKSPAPIKLLIDMSIL